jgi:hypothetical protein
MKMGRRFNEHLVNLTGSKLVSSAVNKYGLENFAFIVLDQLDLLTTTPEEKINLLPRKNGKLLHPIIIA